MDRFKKYRQSDKGKASLKIRTKRWMDSGKGVETRARWVENNKDKIKSYWQKSKINNPNKWMFRTAKARAKKKNQEFTINLEDIEIPENCPILNIPIFVSQLKHSDNSPSLDRIDSSKGYIKGNIQVVSYRANMLKNNGTLEEFEKLVEYMRGLRK